METNGPSFAPAAGDTDARSWVDRVASSKAARVATTAGLLGLAVLLPLLRETGVHSWRRVFAEDGPVYAEAALRRGGLAVVFEGSAGYLQLPPRLLASVSSIIPLDLLALYLAVSGAVVGALLAWFVYVATAGWISSRVVRLALASQVVLMDIAAVEVTGSITNTIWPLYAVLPLALVTVATRRRQVVVAAGVAFFAATATPLTVVFIPLALGWALVRRARSTWIIVSAYAVGLVVQFAVVVSTSDTAKPATTGSVGELTRLAGVRISGVFVVGSPGVFSTSRVWFGDGVALMIGSTLVLLVLLVVLMRGASRRDRLMAGVLVAYGVVTFVVPVWGRGTSSLTWGIGPQLELGGTRFSLAPVFLLSAAFAILVAPVGSTAVRAVARIGRYVFVVHVVVLSILAFPVTNARSEHGVAWASALKDARRTCARADPDQMVKLAADDRGFWIITLPCREVTA